jgi:hypothetical protein
MSVTGVTPLQRCTPIGLCNACNAWMSVTAVANATPATPNGK